MCMCSCVCDCDAFMCVMCVCEKVCVVCTQAYLVCWGYLGQKEGSGQLMPIGSG